MKQFLADFALARYLNRRARKRECILCRRKSDGSLWAASAPQNFAYAMRGLFLRKRADSFHFVRARIWNGVPVISPRVFWLPNSGEFEVLKESLSFWLPPWPETVECMKIDRALAA